MRKKRFISLLTSAVMTAGFMSMLPAGQVVYAETTLVSDAFEVAYDGWTNNGDLTVLTAFENIGYDSSRGMLVTNRQTPQDGAYSEKGFYLDGGNAYDYSVFVRSETAETFHLTLRWLYPDGETYETAEIASVNSEAGVWTELSGEYTAPKGTVNLTLSITTDSTADFSFDDVTVTQTVKSYANTINAAVSDVGLKDIYANKFRVGSVLNGSTVNNNTITAMIIKEFNSISCENEMKPNATLTANGSTNTDIKVSLSQAAKILDFCSKNNIGVRGHTLVWHGQTPTWFFKDNFQNSGNPVSKAIMEQRLESYIKNIFSAIKTQYPNLNLYAYDVVNEAVSDDSSRTGNGQDGSRPGGFEQVDVAPGATTGGSPWVYIYGNNSFIESAFTYAAKYRDQYHPNMKLFYNDYNEWWDHKRDCIIRTILTPLFNKGVLDGMGMQMHINSDLNAWASSVDGIKTALDKYKAVGNGFQIQMTELDVSTEKGKFTAQQQADKYKAVFQAAMDVNKSASGGKVTAIVVWGPNDANTWIGSENTPLLFDANTQKKLAYNTVASLVPESEWGDGTNPGGAEPTGPIEPNEWGWYYHCPFEGDLEEWVGRGDAAISTSARTAYHGSEALLVSGRTASWNGVSRPLNPNPFKPGEKFSFSTNAIYFDGEATDEFFMKLQYTDASGETFYDTIAEVTAVKGEWFQLANTNYQIPSGATNMQIYIETAESTNNFYIDEAIGAVGGVTIVGAGVPEITTPTTTTPTTPTTTKTNPTTTLTTPTTTAVPSNVLYGDINLDDDTNTADLILLAKNLAGRIPQFTGKALINADCHAGGGINSEDLLALIKFLTGEVLYLPVGVVIDVTTTAPTTTTAATTTTTAITTTVPLVDTAKMDALFASITPAKSLKTSGNGNPLMTQRFSADPGFMVYKDRLYVYSTNDVIEYEADGVTIKENSYGQIDKINCMSSSDLVNWTDHGAIPAVGKNGIAKFASQSWAPCATWKTINGKDKFFLYFCNNASGIVVLTADSPTGPWSDPLGKALINPWGKVGVDKPDGCDGVVWWFDPAVFVDDDGTGYLYFGGGIPDGKEANPQTARVVKLGNDMISTVGSAAMIDAPYLFEDSGINKIGNTYYYSYCSNFSTGNFAQTGFRGGVIQYMTSSSPMGPFTYQGEVFRNPSEFFQKDGGNNHHSIVEFKGQYYMLYHARQVQNAMGITGNYRSAQIDKLTVGTDGKLQLVTGTMKGVSQLENLNPYQTVRAATMSWQAGVNVSGVGDTIVTDIQKGDWVSVSKAAFTSGASKVTVRAASQNGAVIKICTGKPDGTAVGYVEIPAGGSFTDITAAVSGLTGTQDLYFVFSAAAEFESWSFS